MAAELIADLWRTHINSSSALATPPRPRTR